MKKIFIKNMRNGREYVKNFPALTEVSYYSTFFSDSVLYTVMEELHDCSVVQYQSHAFHTSHIQLEKSHLTLMIFSGSCVAEFLLRLA
jgi:hypothetical protein